MTFEFIDGLVKQLDTKLLDQENLSDIRSGMLKAKEIIEIFNQYEPGGCGQTEIEFLAELLYRQKTGLYYDCLSNNSDLFRAKAMQAFLEYCFSPNQKIADLEKIRTIKYLTHKSQDKKDKTGLGKYKYTVKHLPLLRDSFLKGLINNEENTEIYLNPKLKELSEFAQHSYDYEQLMDKLDHETQTRQDWARLNLQLGNPKFTEEYIEQLENQIKKEYDKIFKTEIEEFELDYLAELVVRVDLGLLFSNTGNTQDAETFFKIKSMRLIYDCIYEADYYLYDRHSLLESINAAKFHSDKKEEYDAIFQKSQLYELLIARLCVEEVQLKEVEYRLEEIWFKEQRERLEHTMNIVYAPDHTNTELEFLEHTLQYHTQLFGTDLNIELLDQQSTLGGCSNQEFQEKFLIYQKVEFIELQAMEHFCNALREDRDFEDWELHSVKCKFHTINKFLKEEGKEIEYSIMLTNPQISLDLLKYYLKNE